MNSNSIIYRLLRKIYYIRIVNIIVHKMKKFLDKKRACGWNPYLIGDEMTSIIEAARRDNKRIACIMAPIFNEERLKDGYYRRIKAVDDIMGDNVVKIYMSHADTSLIQGIKPAIEVVDENHIRVAYFPWIYENKVWVNKVADKADIVYHHGVGYMDDTIIRNRSLIKIVDLHGVLPEEFAMAENYAMTDVENYHEELAIKYADYIVCVTHQMAKYISDKYPDSKPNYIFMPILDKETKEGKCDCDRFGEAIITYAGGTQKWQMITEMQKAMQERRNYKYHIFVPNPDDFYSSWNNNVEMKELLVKSCTPIELRQEYKKCHYGFVLREDKAVNNVACPTKLIEYLLMGIIPILNTTHLGDFVDTYGMHYISLEDFLTGKLLDEKVRNKYAKENQQIVDKIVNEYEAGKTILNNIVNQGVLKND